MTMDYKASALEIANSLVGKTVRYFANKSKVTENGVRVFKVEAVDNVGIGKKSGRRFVTVLAKDIDDGGEAKHRNLNLAGIDLVV
jgi:F0F1-type ATP synthase beta subunit